MGKIILTSDILNKIEEDFRNENPYSFGVYYDLSSTPAEDLELDENDSSSDGLKNNILDVTFYQKNNFWYIDILLQYEIMSKIVVNFTYTYLNANEEKIENTESLTLSVGGGSISEYKINVPENIGDISISSVLCTPKNDESYKYVVNTNVIKNYSIYYGIRKYNTINSITTEDVITNMLFKKVIKGDNEIEFSMPYVSIEGINDLSDAEYDNILKENAQDFVILYSGNIENYCVSYTDAEIDDNDFIDVSKSIIIDGVEYKILVRSDYSAQSPIREPSEISNDDLYEIHKRIFTIK